MKNKRVTPNEKPTELISQIKKANYIIKKEKHYDLGDGNGIIMTSAYNYNGDYIGNPKDAVFICGKKGIKPEKSKKEHSVCSIGFCENDQKWYGWSHRAMIGFGIGDMIFKERFGDASTHFTKHGDKPIKTFSDAKLSAKRFASYVS